MTNASFPLPLDETLNTWQQCVKLELQWMQANRLPYRWENHHGSIGTYGHKGPMDAKEKTILLASPAAYCCGATSELFLRSWKRWMEGYEDEDFSGAVIYELLRKYFFRRIDLGNKYLKGAMAGLQWLANQSDWLQVQTTEDPSEMPFGAFLQLDFSYGSGDSGHAAVVVGHGTINNRPVVYVWSANKNYSLDSPYTRGQPDGHGWDFYYKDFASRRFYGAWIVP